MVVKIIVTLFVVFALSRVVLRYRERTFGLFALVVWSLLWLFVLFFVWYPQASSVIAESIGVGRGVDALIYISIVALFYGLFRLYVKLEFVEHEITSLVRKIAIKEAKGKSTPL